MTNVEDVINILEENNLIYLNKAYNDLSNIIAYEFSRLGLDGMLKFDKWEAADVCIYALRQNAENHK